MACGAVTSPPKSARANQRHHSGDTWASPLKNTHTHTQNTTEKKKRNEKKKTQPQSKSDTSSFLKEGGGESARRGQAESCNRGAGRRCPTVLTGPRSTVGAWREDLPGQVERHAPRAAAAAIRGADAGALDPLAGSAARARCYPRC